ncbi:cytochrome P450 [Xylogone sp. PMI_703]|nr:cytochrome P450 [Xylogone sp. PMI_703]
MFQSGIDQTVSPSALSLLVASFCLVVLPILGVIRNYIKLRHIPGPFLARFTGLWISVKLWSGESFADITRKLDKEYGPVVRLGPKNVLFTDPSVIPIIYGTNNVFRKAVSYEPAIPVINGRLQDSFVTTRKEERVTVIKKYINSAFTASAIADYEYHVDQTVQLLNDRVTSDAPVVDLVRWLKLFAFETICRIAFSDSNFSEKDVQDTLVGVKERFDHWQRWYALPGLEKLLYKNVFTRGSLSPSLLVKKAIARVNERVTSGGTGTHADLLDRYLQANQKAPEHFGTETVVGLVISIIHAGAETTASTMAITLHFLLSNSAALNTLLLELESANLGSPPTYKSVSKLPYLEAAIKESMRLNAVTIAPLEREVPKDGAQIGGYYIPGGTAVSINDRALSQRSDIWGRDPEHYRPDRWIEADDSQRSKMERAFNGFGQGKRMCIGKNIAWIEMKKAIPELLLNYKVRTIEIFRIASSILAGLLSYYSFRSPN